uniref:Ubiquitin protein 2 n=1 Tax=Solanum tuberosum TaxID=4113 RepID=M1BLY6_SOLTU
MVTFISCFLSSVFLSLSLRLNDFSISLLISVAVPPEELYATQLTQLQEMGFFDTQENIRALTASGGNVHAAVERLLGNLGQ